MRAWSLASSSVIGSTAGPAVRIRGMLRRLLVGLASFAPGLCLAHFVRAPGIRPAYRPTWPWAPGAQQVVKSFVAARLNAPSPALWHPGAHGQVGRREADAKRPNEVSPI